MVDWLALKGFIVHFSIIPRRRSPRVLRVMKSNYGRVGAEIRMRYQRGVFVPEAVSGGDPLAIQVKAERVFLQLLAKYAGQNRYVSTSEGKSYAPFIFASDAAKEGVNKAALKAAMERLLEKGTIENAPYGAPSKKQFRLYIVKQP
jgi:RecA-family ATPase